MFKTIILIALIHNSSAGLKIVRRYFDIINNETMNVNAMGAQIAWELTLDPTNVGLAQKAADYQNKQLTWQQTTCAKLETIQYTTVLNSTQERMIQLLCRGPRYTLDEAREATKLLQKLQAIYADSEICVPVSKAATRDNITSIEEVTMTYLNTNRWEWAREKPYLLNDEEGYAPDSGSICLRGEVDFNRIMRYSRTEEVLKWYWETWRDVISSMKEPYQKLVGIQNRAAFRNGYSDIGESWRADMEIPELREHCDRLYQEVRPLYRLLHGVTRYYLRREYGMMVPERGPIPAHLLGDLWAQNWEPLAGLIFPKTIDLNKEMKESKVKWDLEHMLRRAEDYYMSLGLPAMTDAFWRHSVFSRENHTAARCHGTAADMFKDGDFRIIYCADVIFQDFYVLHHEIGHVQYFMAYEKQPAIFRQANTALHESIGDAIMYGVMTPQHLHRLGLVNDSVLYIKNKVENDDFKTSNVSDIIKELIGEDYDSEEKMVTPPEFMITEQSEQEITADDILLLKQALSKLPQIPFALAMDEFRWKYFESGVNKPYDNADYWAMIERMQGIAPKGDREHYHFDLGAKFHVPDNTPFIRYYLSSFLQHQLFENLCKAAVFGRRNVKQPIPSSILIHRCDIYGSKTAGKLLRDIMSRGHSQSIQDILKDTTGSPEISSMALKRYYRPLQETLQRIVDKYRIPLGW